jgi:galactose-1-phosphate uridylyltransferase
LFCPYKGNGMNKDYPKTCVASSGEFIYGIHKPSFTSFNLRENDYAVSLGHSSDQASISNIDNFPANNVHVAAAPSVFEIPNAFPFMGTTFIVKPFAERMVQNADPFKRQKEYASDLVLPKDFDYMDSLAVERLPRALLMALAKTSTDPQLLARLAKQSCQFEYDPKTQIPSGISYEKTEKGELRPAILDSHLFEIVSNNVFLPDLYKQQMVLVPGLQGKSPIVGEYTEGDTHIWEYLRENSYVPWGHYAANMAHDAIRYKIGSLTEQDMIGLRHLYYQRTYVQLGTEVGIAAPTERRSLTRNELEDIRLCLIDRIEQLKKRGGDLPFNATIWGQNYGFDLSPSGYRLNASHQQIHQQFGLVPSCVPAFKGGENKLSQSNIGTCTQGDLVAKFVKQYKEKTNQNFFETYLKAIRSNRRMDGRADKESDLIFFQDENIVAFVPKAQRSQGEVQIMTKEGCGNIIETETKARYSLDRAILIAMKVLENLGADMISVYEVSKRFDNPDRDQRILYCFLPKHSRSPGGFSECQQRWLIGHYPEDFAKACRHVHDCC